MTERLTSSSVPVRASGEPQKDFAADIAAIVSSYGFLLMRLAVAADAQDTFDVCKREFTEHEAALKRLQDHFLHHRASASPSDDGARQPQGEVTACGLTRDALHKAIARVDADAVADRCAHVRKGATPRGVMCRDCRREWAGEEGERVWKAMADFDADAAASDDGAAREPGLDLEPIKAREAITAKGPWQCVYGGDNTYEVATANNIGCRSLLTGAHIADAKFIAHARQDIPALLAEIERQRADLYVSRKHAADLQTELTLLEQKVQPPVSVPSSPAGR